jgi:hypothetical protein
MQRIRLSTALLALAGSARLLIAIAATCRRVFVTDLNALFNFHIPGFRSSSAHPPFETALASTRR